MCPKATAGRLPMPVLFLGIVCSTVPVWAQVVPDWRRIGNSAVDLSLPSPATGPIERVWFSDDGAVVRALTRSGRVFATSDFERWTPAEGGAPVMPEAEAAVRLPENGARLRLGANRLYAIGTHAWRSEDGGANWSNLTAWRGESILRGKITDLAVSARDAEEIVAANEFGLWRSVDGGRSWTGINEGLPNLPVRRLVATPSGSRGVRILAGDTEAEWAPGEKAAWRTAPGEDAAVKSAVRDRLSAVLGAQVTAVASAGRFLYAGTSAGALYASTDGGESWNPFVQANAGPVEAITIDRNDGRFALAALGAATPANAQLKAAHVLRTTNAGMFWDDLTANLPDAAAHGVTVDRASGTIYIATDAGLFMTSADLGVAGPATPWTGVGGGLPAGAVRDCLLDPGGNQLYVAVDGYGVYAAIAPHRSRSARVVNAADYTARAAAPGSLLSVLGMRVQRARAGQIPAPVLDANSTASQIQVPFELQGDTVSLALEGAAGTLNVGLALQASAPAVFVDPDGTPMILDADTGLLLDAANPAHSHSRVQVLATGLGSVTPAWPSGVAAPLSDPPRVTAPVKAYLDREPVEVTRAVLAPGYVGFYLIEVQMPPVVNAGPAELVVEAGGQSSNRVRLYLQR